MSAVAERAGIPRESLYTLRIRADQRHCQMAGGLMQRFPKKGLYKSVIARSKATWQSIHPSLRGAQRRGSL